MNQNGTDVETLNHIGRHELHGYLPASRNDDPNIIEYYGQLPRFNPNPIGNMFHIKEDPNNPGLYYGIDAPEFQTHSAGQVVNLYGSPEIDADHMEVIYITHPETSGPSNSPSPDHSGLYRDVLPLSGGTLVAAHTPETRADANEGTRALPTSRYDFRIKTLKLSGNNYWVGDQPLTSGISETVTYWDPDVLVTYSGELWELQPVEVRPRERPKASRTFLPLLERLAFRRTGVKPTQLRTYMKANNLALVVSRNVTTRDDFDLQQPFNLRVPDGVQTLGAEGAIYDVVYMQFFQGDQIRGYGYPTPSPNSGRRILALPMHDSSAITSNPPNPAGPEGSS